MKKIFFSLLFLLVACRVLFALEVTDSVDRDRFQYIVGYRFATDDLAASITRAELPIIPTASQPHNFYYTIHRGGTDSLQGRIVGISVSQNGVTAAGAATFDVTVNGQLTGVQTVIEASPVRAAVGNTGSSGNQFAYMRQDRSEEKVHQGFNVGSKNYDDDSFFSLVYPYGKATPLTAGNRIGVRVTTTSNFSANNDVVVMVYVLE